MPDATFGNPVGVNPECPSYGNHNHLDYTQTPGIPGCEGDRQNKAAVRQRSQSQPDKAGQAELPHLSVCPLDLAKASCCKQFLPA